MARSFNGTSDTISFSLGAVPKTSANVSFAAIILTATNQTTVERDLFTVSQGTTSEWEFFLNASGSLSFWNGSAAASSTTNVTNSAWWMVGMSKVAAARPRFHFYSYASGVPSHADAIAGTSADNTAAASPTVYISGYRGTSLFFSDTIAIMGVWNRILTDAEFELLPFSLSYWIASQPSAFWLFDQAATTQKVIDATGNGANQSTITGTSVSANSVPIFSYGNPIRRVELQPIPALSGTALLSGNGSDLGTEMKNAIATRDYI